MTDVASCKNDKCIHKNNCYRYAESKGEPIAFINVCNEANNYQWLMEINKDLEVKDNE
jgi:hypothetical protein